ncbi:MAG TPA: hypothetical protein PKI19_14125, partial [Elusimicrobiales bacterium]|nr:hypothetical protein [Elusimicrobiales bacterium]
MIKNKLILLIISTVFTAGNAYAKPAAAIKKPAPAAVLAGLTAGDMPYDAGEAVLLRWPAAPDAAPGTTYAVQVSSAEAAGWRQVAEFGAAEKTGKDIELPFWAWNGAKNEHAVKVELNNLFGDFPPGSVFNVKVSVMEKGALKAESLP